MKLFHQQQSEKEVLQLNPNIDSQKIFLIYKRWSVWDIKFQKKELFSKLSQKKQRSILYSRLFAAVNSFVPEQELETYLLILSNVKVLELSNILHLLENQELLEKVIKELSPAVKQRLEQSQSKEQTNFSVQKEIKDYLVEHQNAIIQDQNVIEPNLIVNNGEDLISNKEMMIVNDGIELIQQEFKQRLSSFKVQYEPVYFNESEKMDNEEMFVDEKLNELELISNSIDQMNPLMDKLQSTVNKIQNIKKQMESQFQDMPEDDGNFKISNNAYVSNLYKNSILKQDGSQQEDGDEVDDWSIERIKDNQEEFGKLNDKQKKGELYKLLYPKVELYSQEQGEVRDVVLEMLRVFQISDLLDNLENDEILFNTILVIQETGLNAMPQDG